MTLALTSCEREQRQFRAVPPAADRVRAVRMDEPQAGVALPAFVGTHPYEGNAYAISEGKRADFWAQTITFTELGSLSIAVALIVTIVHLRAPGMALHRIPLFVWSILVMSWMVIFAMPTVMLASTMLLMDRLVGTQLFNPVEGGDALLWQHLCRRRTSSTAPSTHWFCAARSAHSAQRSLRLPGLRSRLSHLQGF